MKSSLLLVVCVSYLMVAVVAAESLQLVLLNSSYATSIAALCNDNSPPGFYWGAGSSAQKWVIHLQGGAWCYDQASCASRWQDSRELMSSTVWPTAATSFANQGLFDQNQNNNPYFYDYNHVYVTYCSSDAWAGNALWVAPDGSARWQFRGRPILDALIHTLVQDYNLAQATDILYSGCSAGGQGVVNTVDYVYDLLVKNHVNMDSVRFKGMADAGWLMNVQPYKQGIISVPGQMQEGLLMWNGVANEQCMHANPDSQWMCFMSQYAWPHFSTPTMIQTEQFDGWQDPYNCCSPPFNSSQQVYIDRLRTAVQSSLREIRYPSGAFSAACYYHCSTEDGTFTSIRIQTESTTYSLSDWLGIWFNDMLTSKNNTVLIDDCSPVGCSVGCP
eukprot:CAMPEP_0177646668 /NCGR_PEP_ID=MMETSP0447-20121125/9892_1 /TAXON_ID=0 /ORGANISM="Stygamoeba regulata, Strain BSH-02190019" /LENGTH=387 /DNA_ID=CAMNT_0019149207 /DNA_START=42 /DNA_END=1205 /DNA_ORIENTATION=+